MIKKLLLLFWVSIFIASCNKVDITPVSNIT